METTVDIEQLKYPLGRFKPSDSISDTDLKTWISEIEQLPQLIRHATAGLTDAQLNTPYRPDGWTIRQVVHHLPDSHLNSYMRFKLAVTETDPVIKPYDEAAWANTVEAKTGAIEPSLLLLEGLHQRWSAFLKTLTPEQWKLGFIHPDHGRRLQLDWTLGLYAWHGKHHLAHITETRKRNQF